MTPGICRFWIDPIIEFSIFQNDDLIKSEKYQETEIKPVLITEDKYTAGDKFKINVRYYWIGFVTKDYTVKVYSK